MKRILVFSMLLFLSLLFFVGCDSSYPTVPDTFPDDGGMGSYDSQFISVINSLDDPWKLNVWLDENVQYNADDIVYTPYDFYIHQEGQCADYSIFNCFVLHYHDYVVHNVQVYFIPEPELSSSHAITVYETKAEDAAEYWFWKWDKYGYLSVNEFNPGGVGKDFNSIEDCVNHYMSKNSKYKYSHHVIHPWNHMY